MSPVITVVALNPAIDRTLEVPGFAAGRTNRARSTRVDPGGKGVNVARVARRLGAEVRLVGLLGAADGELIAGAVAEASIDGQFVRVPGENRVNIKLVDPESGVLTEINETGFSAGPEHLEALTALLLQALAGSHMLVLTGSLPEGIPDTCYRDLIHLATGAGVPTILDAAGEPLRAALSARPALIKPNQAEAAELLSRSLHAPADISAAARSLLELGPQQVVISAGGSGAVLAGPYGLFWASPPAVRLGSTVGAGDSMVAALAVGMAEGLAPEQFLQMAAAAGTASASLPGTQLCARTDVERLTGLVSVRPLHLDSR